MEKQAKKNELKKAIISIIKNANEPNGLYQKGKGVYLIDVMREARKKILTEQQNKRPQYFGEEHIEFSKMVRRALEELEDEGKIEERLFNDGTVAYA